MLTELFDYEMFHCSIHKIYIYYFKQYKGRGYHCWHCLRDKAKAESEAKKKDKKQNG